LRDALHELVGSGTHVWLGIEVYLEHLLKHSNYIQVAWGRISMVDAERRLLANALEDTNNQHFVLLSDR